MSSLTAGWVLSGASSQWKNAKPGKVFDTLLNGEYANPVIVVDEIDKASGDGQYDPLGALYELLEVETSTRFIDEFVELPIDATGAVWLATANDAARIPEPLFFCQAEDGIRDGRLTGVQTCALPILTAGLTREQVLDPDLEVAFPESVVEFFRGSLGQPCGGFPPGLQSKVLKGAAPLTGRPGAKIGRASCRERV